MAPSINAGHTGPSIRYRPPAPRPSPAPKAPAPPKPRRDWHPLLGDRTVAKADEELAHPDWTTPAGDVRRKRRYRLTRGGRIVKATGEQLGLFGGMGETRKPVKEPGKRGGKWYTTDRGEIRYGQKPAPTAEPTVAPIVQRSAAQVRAEVDELRRKGLTAQQLAAELNSRTATMAAETRQLERALFGQAAKPTPGPTAPVAASERGAVPVLSLPGGEGVEMRIYQHGDGYSVTLHDRDAGTNTGEHRLFHGADALDKAKEYARAIATDSLKRTVPRHIHEAIAGLREMQDILQKHRETMGRRYEADAYDNLKMHQEIARYEAHIANFRKHAPAHGIEEPNLALSLMGYRGTPMLSTGAREYLPRSHPLHPEYGMEPAKPATPSTRGRRLE